MAEILLETARLYLRAIEAGDALHHHHLFNTPAVMARLGGVRPLEFIKARHARSRRLQAREGFGFMMMVEKASGEMVGHCGMKRVDNARARNRGDHEVGWLVREDRWRRGYAHEAMRAVLERAFAHHRVPHVVALTSPNNEPSWQLMRKLGMERRADLDFTDPQYPPEDNPTMLYWLPAQRWVYRQ